MNNVTLKDLKDGLFRPAGIDDARDAVRDFYEQLTLSGDGARPKVKPENIWVVASSGLTLNRPANYNLLEKAVEEAGPGAPRNSSPWR